jgi:hypothetical protein
MTVTSKSESLCFLSGKESVSFLTSDLLTKKFLENHRRLVDQFGPGSSKLKDLRCHVASKSFGCRLSGSDVGFGFGKLGIVGRVDDKCEDVGLVLGFFDLLVCLSVGLLVGWFVGLVLRRFVGVGWLVGWLVC